ncbi:MAG: DUF4442 domain-containing protein [Myxococcales bacterium]|nr:DUF4442 domain-containing protein [Myxococcales bacterium]MCB9520269.1 DUF4442 domain-containing protein [Myxococcales bacterium]MCB9531363.1 DUF4442 domain-containing protein [Myxococcales bacterium]MCB9533564.1 DUF4442 domain-containing protein [Myxococcales bacterium]
MKTLTPSTATIRAAWDRLHRLPGGKLIFSRMVGKMAPYTGTIDARVEELRDGYGRVVLADRKGVRNHLNSIHAIALANLGEMVSGVTMLYAMHPDLRGILTGLDVEYLKKARGTLTATCEVEPITELREHRPTLHVEIKDASGEVVCRVHPKWLIRPR